MKLLPGYQDRWMPVSVPEVIHSRHDAEVFLDQDYEDAMAEVIRATRTS